VGILVERKLEYIRETDGGPERLHSFDFWFGLEISCPQLLMILKLLVPNYLTECCECSHLPPFQANRVLLNKAAPGENEIGLESSFLELHRCLYAGTTLMFLNRIPRNCLDSNTFFPYSAIVDKDIQEH
jgi:hypothetical protein